MENQVSRQYHPLVTPTTIELTHSQFFNERFFYEGKLGYSYDTKQTLFRLWSPLAVEVFLVQFSDETSEAQVVEKFSLIKNEGGVFELTLLGDYDGMVYLYELHFETATTLTNDPYAKACTANGQHSVVLSDKACQIPDFERLPAFTNPNEAIIYEVHVRDFSIANTSGIRQKGKYLGVVEENSSFNGEKTGFDYLKQLGVTHVQFLPLFDFETVDETNIGVHYNWGYDPQHYNVPEGSYSSDPFDPACRIKELKYMIKKLHDSGLRVIMDVVYNHVFDARTHPFNNVVPSYYFRYEPDFTPANGTACGNDTASEQPMMRKYIVDSICYWAKEFHLDGFRFDLMGNHDIETMRQVRAALDEIDPSIIVLGEGWNLETPLRKKDKATQTNADKMPGIAHFNDSLRDAVKGSVFYDEIGGLVNSQEGNARLVWKNMQGATDLPLELAHYTKTNQVVQYVEAHDNLTLFDKLVKTNPDDSEELRMRRFKVATTIALLSQGIAFLHAGQEFMRTKQRNDNSYRSSDYINQMDWELMTKSSVQPFMKQLLAFRRKTPSLHLSDPESITKAMQLVLADKKIIIFNLLDEVNYQVVINASLEPLRYERVGEVILASTAVSDNGKLPEMSVTIIAI